MTQPKCMHCGCYADEHQPPPPNTSPELLKQWCPGFDAEIAHHNRAAIELVLSKWFPVGGEISQRERVLVAALLELADRVDADSPKPEDLTIASALSAFDPDTEAQLCAFLQTSEESRTRGLLQGWKLQTGPNGQCCALLLPGGEVVTATRPTLSEAMTNVSHQLITGNPTGEAIGHD